MKNETEQFKVVDGEKFTLADFDPGYTGKYKKEDAESLLDELGDQMSELQEKLYAANTYSLLIIFQAMDAAGKDSAIKHTMSGLNPQGCQVFSFKQPSSEELDHDFLWRHAKALPERGRIGIHNRSHYENVLVCKIHPEYILKENIASVSSIDSIDKKFWEARYESIRNFEKHVHDNGTVIIKFFLNVSKDEQKKRFLERMDDPLKNWKFSPGDLEERKKWDDYMKVYEEAIQESSATHAPWYIIPADKKWFTRIAVSKVIIGTLKELSLSVAELSETDKKIMIASRAALENEK
jgi:PPK2 family polyphosphate:nucleotide phosphotransferase